ncbi:MAG: carboxymuconolactone decarboxylase family protein [Magnetospirillum gryphiswaldense]|nr:carboxymuconolactone decarboxylase family protein [Magnetospirillum gryphiswaldense]
MNIRFDVSSLAKPAYQALYAASEALAASSLGAGFKHLIDLRVSQINKCLFCQNLHADWGLRDGVGQDRLDAVADWAKSDLFTPAEKSAFAWAEALTRQQEESVPALLADLRGHYSEQQIAELTMIVGVINAWNRVGISAYDHG